MSIKKVCDCKSENISIFSAVKKQKKVNGTFVPTVEITYICNDCGEIDVDKSYLYKK